MSKNLSGQGTTRQRPDGRWEARYHVLDERGRPQRRSVYGKTAEEVRLKLATKTRGRDLGVPEPKPYSSRMTVAQFLEIWLQDRSRDLRPSGWEAYRKTVKGKLIPGLGKIQLTRLTHRHLDAFYGQLERQGLRPSTIQRIHHVMRTALRAARQDGLIGTDPSELVRRLPSDDSEHRGLTVAEMVRLLEISDDRSSPLPEALLEGDRHHGVFFAMALWGGFRFGELAALHWHDIDFSTRLVTVEQAVSAVTIGTAQALGLKQRVFLQKPKTRSSRRQVLLPQEVMERLAQHRSEQIERFLAADGRSWSDDGNDELIFQNGAFHPLYRTAMNAIWHRLQSAAGIPRERQVRLHDTRRTAISVGSGAGLMRAMQDRVGHRESEMTLHYTDAQSQEPIVSHMEGAVAKVRAKYLKEAQ